MKSPIPCFKLSIIVLTIAAMFGCGGGGSAPAASDNAAPVANAGATQNVAVGTVVTLNGGASSDADGDVLTDNWVLTTRPANSLATLANANTVTPTFTADQPGTYIATLVVNDGQVNSPEATVTITAATTVSNTAPVANAGSAQNVSTGAVVTLNGSASSDANGDTLTYSWELTTKPANSTAALGNANTATPTFTADKAGNYIVSLVVNDGMANSAAATVTITATATDVTGPTITAGPFALGTTATSTTLAVTINENGTGYYLVKTTAEAAPTKAEVLAGTAFPMSANVEATQNIGGLAASTEYVIYFVARDSANNLSIGLSVGTRTETTFSGVQGGLNWWIPNQLKTWPDAHSYCASYSINGQGGWRLPTTDELVSLDNWGGVPATMGYYYWSSVVAPPGTAATNGSLVPTGAEAHQTVLVDDTPLYIGWGFDVPYQIPLTNIISPAALGTVACVR